MDNSNEPSMENVFGKISDAFTGFWRSINEAFNKILNCEVEYMFKFSDGTYKKNIDKVISVCNLADSVKKYGSFVYEFDDQIKKVVDVIIFDTDTGIGHSAVNGGDLDE
jgi:hypothetical protein